MRRKKAQSRRTSVNRPLERLARACGIAVRFENWGGAVVSGEPATFVRLIHALTGAKLPDNPSAAAIDSLYRKIEKERRKPEAAGVLVAWGGRLNSAWFWFMRAPGKLSLVLKTEEGAEIARPEIRSAQSFRRSGRWRVRLDWAALRIPLSLIHI